MFVLLQIAVALPPPYTAETVNEWAESFFESFLAEETANRIKAEEEAAVREAKRLKERNAAKVGSGFDGFYAAAAAAAADSVLW
jgi:hypothetical protein